MSLSSRFPLDDAPALLSQHFSSIRVIEIPGTITITDSGPVVAHLASYSAWADQTGVPFAATVERAQQLLDMHISRNGNYTITCRGGILVAAQG